MCPVANVAQVLEVGFGEEKLLGDEIHEISELICT